MRWRFLDKIDSFKPFKEIAGRHAVSLEEYHLLERFGRKGEFPESLVVESCVELVRWLLAKSSDFRQTCILSEVEHWRFLKVVGAGDVLKISAAAIKSDENFVRAECRARRNGEEVAGGTLAFSVLPLRECSDSELIEGMWKELYGAS